MKMKFASWMFLYPSKKHGGSRKTQKPTVLRIFHTSNNNIIQHPTSLLFPRHFFEKKKSLNSVFCLRLLSDSSFSVSGLFLLLLALLLVSALFSCAFSLSSFALCLWSLFSLSRVSLSLSLLKLVELLLSHFCTLYGSIRSVIQELRFLLKTQSETPKRFFSLLIKLINQDHWIPQLEHTKHHAWKKQVLFSFKENAVENRMERQIDNLERTLTWGSNHHEIIVEMIYKKYTFESWNNEIDIINILNVKFTELLTSSYYITECA
jgi:hypothetical protein